MSVQKQQNNINNDQFQRVCTNPINILAPFKWSSGFFSFQILFNNSSEWIPNGNASKLISINYEEKIYIRLKCCIILQFTLLFLFFLHNLHLFCSVIDLAHFLYKMYFMFNTLKLQNQVKPIFNRNICTNSIWAFKATALFSPHFLFIVFPFWLCVCVFNLAVPVIAVFRDYKSLLPIT